MSTNIANINKCKNVKYWKSTKVTVHNRRYTASWSYYKKDILPHVIDCTPTSKCSDI